MSGQGTSLALIGAYVLAGELAAASGGNQAAFHQYEKELRPFVMRPMMCAAPALARSEGRQKL
jgi:2-polyprenyl-6-methoxyphenol hydroxylase-like FAD-dependent oxidoreductase